VKRSGTIGDLREKILAGSPYKIWNLLLLQMSFFLSRQFGKVIHRGLPFTVSIEPTTSCNLRCPECPSGLRSFSRQTGMLNQENFSLMLAQLKKSVWAMNFYFQGEPYLNRDFLSMVKQAADAGIYTITSTNAHYLNREGAENTVHSGLHRLIVSIDGTSQETYSAYRVGGQLEKVIEGTRNVLDARKRLKSSTPRVIFQFLVVRPNEHEVNEAKHLAEQLGVDEIRFKTAQIYNYEQGSPLIPLQDQYSRYRKTSSGSWELKNKYENHCWRMWQGCVITWDGKVVPCCFDKDASHTLGNILQFRNFKEIWKGPQYKQFRTSVINNRASIDICRNCSEGTQVFS
jgi:radical SAM protein with 4Fe4S-binding SPASM domain